jgi:uncharacterized secreted protein with C-terminal beta-propeller domain
VKNKDFEFINSMFENENITAPDSLSAENIKLKLEEGAKPNNYIKLRKNNFKLKRALAFVACFAIVVCATFGATYANAKVTKVDGIVYYSSYTAVKKTFNKVYYSDVSVSDIFNFASTDKYSSDGDVTAVSESTATGANSFSQTLTQEENIDEADVVKTDGEYIYYLYEDEILIYSANGKKTKCVAKIENDSGFFSEMYISGNYLVTTGFDYDSDDRDVVATTVYDVSDRANPTLKYTMQQNGIETTSRLIGNYVYTVSNYYVYSKKNYVPYATQNDGKFEKISCDCIVGFENPIDTTYTIVSAMDITKGTKTIKSKAVFGGGSSVYASEKNLYILAGNSKTDIIKISLNGTKIKFVAQGRVNGYVNDQYSVSEDNGLLRIATTINSSNGYSNRLYVLDEKLNTIGKTKLFAKDETIKAVRYIGNTAYAITYEQTDPLFVIDLTDSENPVVKGSVKIDGFSTSLLPVDSNTILGIGYDDKEYIKLVLFDISNSENPTILDSKVFKNYVGDVQSNIKALMRDNSLNYYAFCYDYWDYYTDEHLDEHSGVVTFEINNSKINVGVDKKVYGKTILNNRCVSISHYLYYLDSDEVMHTLDMLD